MEVILDNMSMPTSPVRPKAVVWYSPGRFFTAQCKISLGGRVCKCALIPSSSAGDSGGCTWAGGCEVEVDMSERMSKVVS